MWTGGAGGKQDLSEVNTPSSLGIVDSVLKCQQKKLRLRACIS
jgi:hypothetical protein